MNLVYKEFIQFLNNKGLKEQTNIELQEGYYWFDRLIVKAYDKNGNIHKIIRLNINDDLSITFKTYKKENFNIESWQDTVQRNKNKLLKLENDSLNLIKDSIYKFYNRRTAILSSSGKDSSVVTYLVKQLLKNPLVIFNNTTLDCADTYNFIKKEPNLRIINPKEGFYQWRKRLNFVGNRLSRACCTVFKEGAMVSTLDKNDKYLFFMGMRNQESNTRSGYVDEWKNEKWGKREWDAVLPIRKWSEEEIWLYILLRNIEINPKYKKGYSRCGCAIACPYATKSTWVLDEYWYPDMYERWHNILDEDFIKNKKAPILNCTNAEYHINWNGGVVREEPTEEVIQEFSKQQNLDIDIARKYFNKKCLCCEKKLKKDDIGLSMKLYGRQIEKFKCMKCIGKETNKTNKELKELINSFKSSGCDLF